MPHRMNPGNLLDSRNGRFLTFGMRYVSEGMTYGFSSDRSGPGISTGTFAILV